jgi:hypothetical protein
VYPKIGTSRHFQSIPTLKGRKHSTNIRNTVCKRPSRKKKKKEKKKKKKKEQGY